MGLIARRITLLGALALALTVASCGERRVGAGSRETRSASGARLTALYGLKTERHLGFVIFVQFPTPVATTSSSSKWIGGAKHESGAMVRYKASLADIDINRTSFTFDKGRVFFVKSASGAPKIHQLNLALGDGPVDLEVDRIAASPEVEALIP